MQIMLATIEKERWFPYCPNNVPVHSRAWHCQ